MHGQLLVTTSMYYMYIYTTRVTTSTSIYIHIILHNPSPGVDRIWDFQLLY